MANIQAQTFTGMTLLIVQFALGHGLLFGKSANIWKIRQFQFIGSPSSTAYREARRFANSEAAQETLERIGSEQLTAIVDASDKGDFKTFVELSGGACVPLKSQPLRALHVAKETPNKYGEAIKKLIGLCLRELKRLTLIFANGLFALWIYQLRKMISGWVLL